MLQLISRAPTDLDRLLEEISRAAVRLCEAEDAYLLLAQPGQSARAMDLTNGEVNWQGDLELTLRRPMFPAYLEGRTVHVHGPIDQMLAEYPDLHTVFHGDSVLATRFAVTRDRSASSRAGPSVDQAFTPAQIAVLETFAEQAVIAIETRVVHEPRRATARLRSAGAARRGDVLGSSLARPRS